MPTSCDVENQKDLAFLMMLQLLSLGVGSLYLLPEKTPWFLRNKLMTKTTAVKSSNLTSVLDDGKGGTVGAISSPATSGSSATNNASLAPSPPSDAPISLPPEWNDSEIASEKWSSKHAFEDGEGDKGLPFLPRHLRGAFMERFAAGEGSTEGCLKRFCDLPGSGADLVVVGSAISWDDVFVSTAALPGIGSYSDLKPILDSQTPESPASQTQTRHGRKLSTVGHGGSSLVVQAEKSAGNRQNSRRVSTSPSRQNSSGTTSVLDTIPTPITPPSQTNSVPASFLSRPEQLSLDESDHANAVSKLVAANKHLLASSFMTNLLTAIHFLYDHARIIKSNQTGEELFLPWDCIYPKGKDGMPMYNPSGKYAVRLFWMGCWRKVIIDDRVCVDAAGKNLLLCSSNPNELWPTLLSKAILKLATASYKDDCDSGEFGDFDVLSVLRGWIPERIPVSPGHSSTHQLSGLLTTLLHKQIKQVNPTRNRGDTVTPAGARQSTSITPGGSGAAPNPAPPSGQGKSPTMFPLIIGFRKENEFRAFSAKGPILYHHLPCTYRIIDTHRMAGTNSRGFLVRQYLSAGMRKKVNGVVPSSNGVFGIDEVDYSDTWLLAEELTTLFSTISLYHTPGHFKCVKQISSILDGAARQADIIRVPMVFYTPEDLLFSADPGVLITLHTFGKSVGSVNNCACLIVEELGDRGESKDSVIRMTTNGSSSSFLLCSPGTAYRISIEASSSYQVALYSKDDFFFEEEGKYVTDILGLRVREFEDTIAAQQAGTWSILFKHVVMVTDPAFITCRFYSSDAVMASTCIRAINNDTLEEVGPAGYGDLTGSLAPNKNGYTLVGECRAIQARSATKWKLRLYSDTLAAAMIEKELFTTKMTAQDINEVYTPNRHNILFRSLIKIKDGLMNPNNLSVQVDFSFTAIWLDLVLYDNDIEICRAKGKGAVSIFNVLLYPSEDSPVISTKGGTTAEKNKQAPPPTTNTATTTQPPPKHKYILQCSIVASDVEKLSNAAAMIAEMQRPNSRGGKTVTSAGKKKKGGPPAAAPVSNNPNPSQVTTAAAPGAGDSSAPEFSWHARYISTDNSSMIIVKDTEKEDRYRSIKESWEANAPGRANKAKELRETYGKWCDAGLKNLLIALPEGPEKGLRSWSLMKGEGMAPKVLIYGDRNGVGGGVTLVASANDTNVLSAGPVPITKESSKLGGQTITPAAAAATLSPSKSSRPQTALNAISAADESMALFLSNTTVHSLTHKVVSAKPLPAVVLTDATCEEKVRQRGAALCTSTDIHAEILRHRALDRESRSLEKKRILEILETRARNLEAVAAVDITRREAYRLRCIADREEELAAARAKAAIEAARAGNDIDSAEADAVADKKGAKKVAKK